MFIFIVVPNLNKGRFLERALQSVFAQDYDKFDVIAVDGGSTDGSLEILERHHNRFAEFICEPDNGQADAINKGFRLARGEVVAWLNSDDTYYPGVISRAAAVFQENTSGF